MTASFDFTALPETEQVACYGSFFAMAAHDGSMDKDELSLIFETLDLENLSDEARKTVRAYLVDPPKLADALAAVADGREELRYGLMVHLTDISLADDVIVDEEKEALAEAQQILGVSDEQARAIESFIREVRRIRARGLDDNVAVEAIKSAASSLSAVGVPIAAVYFSGSVLGLSAAGITSGLAALGLGFGMVPGIGMAVLLGVATYMTVGRVLGWNKAQKTQQLQAERERRAQLVVRNLQEAIDHLVEQIAGLSAKAALADANAEAIARLTSRLHALQQALARRQA